MLFYKQKIKFLFCILLWIVLGIKLCPQIVVIIFVFETSGNQIFLICVLCRKLHQQFEMYKEQVKKMGEESQQQQEQKGDAPTCGICHKTKFADGCGHNCSYCQTKFCARCGGRVSLRSNKVQNENYTS